tara:strand:+ start:914 stop:1342 length:429 start_codon:yes stop_codon:yes gene_type:complete
MKQTLLFFALMTLALILPGQAHEKGVQPSPPAHIIKLVFQIKSPEEGEEFLILSSGGPYSITRSHTDPNFEHLLELSGDATSLPGCKNVRFTYTVQRHDENLKKGEKGLHSLRGSAILKSGKATILGNLGAHLLTVTATIVE